ncbi:hypothetical protein ACIBK9_47350 [Nonomuraea sp. NPDC050227]|uniref:hypothetical protein n=1 Tax=Nonomuraea sp. NPDC050227 TaxID=3364360 RepID=UPI00378C13D8
MTAPPETTAGLLKIREDWLKVIAIESPHGGFDIAVVIDGSYDRQYYDPADLKETWAKRLKAALAVDGLPLGVPLSQCPNKAALLGGEPMPALPVPSPAREETPNHG